MAWERDYSDVGMDERTLRAVTLTDQDLRDIIAVLNAHPLPDYSSVKFKADEHRTTDPNDLFDLPQKPSRLVLMAGTDIFVFLNLNQSSVHLEKSSPEAQKAGDKIVQILAPRQVPTPKKFGLSKPFVLGMAVAGIVGLSVFYALRTALPHWWAYGIATATAWIVAGYVGYLTGRAPLAHSLLARYEPRQPWYLQHHKVLSLVLAVLAIVVSALALLPSD